ncbi:hypothetical protein DHEL01_v205639 [Diaporthe helianthi]|uniref:Uncharacterized protein n=1 Tax=Diaporthe helianthi TaxID=158607 RepID=A0A2P5I0F1_DIAHE|nr:hypothetical protein DHEL01_v205639 [Diaporthe helianthi]
MGKEFGTSFESGVHNVQLQVKGERPGVRRPRADKDHIRRDHLGMEHDGYFGAGMGPSAGRAASMPFGPIPKQLLTDHNVLGFRGLGDFSEVSKPSRLCWPASDQITRSL